MRAPVGKAGLGCSSAASGLKVSQVVSLQTAPGRWGQAHLCTLEAAHFSRARLARAPPACAARPARQAILGAPLGMTRLMDLLGEQEVLRNEALLLLTQVRLCLRPQLVRSWAGRVGGPCPWTGMAAAHWLRLTRSQPRDTAVGAARLVFHSHRAAAEGSTEGRSARSCAPVLLRSSLCCGQ